jgi:hypothetical protein
MIYFITFILTLLFSHITRAAPACGDVASPEEPYDPMFADARTPYPLSSTILRGRGDSARTGFKISKVAFTDLNGKVGGGTLQAEAKVVSPRFCHFDAEDPQSCMLIGDRRNLMRPR